MSVAWSQLARKPLLLGQPTEELVPLLHLRRSANQLELWAAANKLPIYDAAIDLCQRLGIEVPQKGQSSGCRESGRTIRPNREEE